jgi:ribosome-associated toxin RatA of RatAB toxin-antitoxin module
VPTVTKSALVPFSAGALYELVADVESYPTFLPWCKSTTVHYRRDEEVKATIEISRGPIRKSFTTVNSMVHHRSIEMRLVEGPFRYLEGTWTFKALGDEGSKISLYMTFEFESGLINLSFGPVFTGITNSLVDAFSSRAAEVYGKR